METGTPQVIHQDGHTVIKYSVDESTRFDPDKLPSRETLTVPGTLSQTEAEDLVLLMFLPGMSQDQ